MLYQVYPEFKILIPTVKMGNKCIEFETSPGLSYAAVAFGYYYIITDLQADSRCVVTEFKFDYRDSSEIFYINERCRPIFYSVATVTDLNKAKAEATRILERNQRHYNTMFRHFIRSSASIDQ